jgi:hypothetical protein
VLLGNYDVNVLAVALETLGLVRTLTLQAAAASYLA